MFDEEQADKWVEKVYNQDARYKYIGPRISNVYDAMFMLQGKRDLHRRWWLAKRFSIYDAKYVSGTYKSQAVEIKCLDYTPAGQQFTITAGYALDYGYGINNRPRKFGVSLNVGESYTFTTEEDVNIGDPIGIYGAPNIAVLDFSKMASRLNVINMGNIYNEAIGTKLKKLILGNINMENVAVKEISGIQQAFALEYIDIQGMKGLTALDLSAQQYIKTVKAYGSNIASVIFAKGAPVERLELPATMRTLSLEQLPYLVASNVVMEDISNLTGMIVKSCPNVSNDFNFVWSWISNKATTDDKCSIIMDGVNWSGVSGAQMVSIASLGNVSLKGKIKLTELTRTQAQTLISVFGESVFDKNAELYIDAPITVSLIGPSSVLEGDTAQFTTEVYPTIEGVVRYSLDTTKNGCSIDAETGLLTTIEDGAATSDVVVRTTFTSNEGKVTSATATISVVQRVYPTGITISGNGNLRENTTFTWNATNMSEVTGSYSVEWKLSDNLASYYNITTSGTSCTLVPITVPPTQVNGTLTLILKKNNDGSTAASSSISVNYSYVYPTSVTIFGLAGIIGGNTVTYSAIINPPNVDIGVSYTWSISGSSNASVESSNGATCVVKTTTPNDDVEVVLTCTVKTSDNKVTIQGSFTINLMTRENYVMATYDVSSTTSPTQLLYSITDSVSDILLMEVDGVEVTPSLSYTFSSTGLHKVKFTLKRINGMWCDLPSLKELDFTNCDGSQYSIGGKYTTGVSRLVNTCTNLTKVDFRGFMINAPRGFMQNLFYNCHSLKEILFDGVVFKSSTSISLNSMFEKCSSLEDIHLSMFDGPIDNLTYAFYGCSSLKTLTFTQSEINIPAASDSYQAFVGCSSLQTIIIPLKNAFLINDNAFGTYEGNWTGYNTSQDGINKLYVPAGATGYDEGAWVNTLLNPNKCSFTLVATL
jgi:hypothetical protein